FGFSSFYIALILLGLKYYLISLILDRYRTKFYLSRRCWITFKDKILLFYRYWFALKYGYQAAFKQKSSGDAPETDSPNLLQKQAIDVVTDINMLRIFKTFLETTPQLCVQIYILMEHGKSNFSQYVAIIMSFGGISFSTVDYQISLQKSLPDKDEFPVLSRLVCLFYKLLTITSWILSITMIKLLSVRSSVILPIFLWICGFTWTLKQGTTFCKSKKMEYLYRTVTVVTLGILFVYIFWKPSVIKEISFTIVSILTILSLALGIIFLVVYYRCFHPIAYCRPHACSDEVDGKAGQKDRVKICRFQNFIMQ
uniref:XK-related protein n=1 Tax=Strigops habroptila TaxID=2489341 RepID=A0A672U5Q6_STRHB